MNADPEEAEDEAVDPRRAWEKKQVGELKLELKSMGYRQRDAKLISSSAWTRIDARTTPSKTKRGSPKPSR